MPITFCENCESTGCRCEGGAVEAAAQPAEASVVAHLLLDWLKEREANARRIAAGKTGEDRAGWLEDAMLFEAAAAAVWHHAEAITALQGLLDALPSATTHPAIKRARAAIARATTVPNEANHE